MAAPQIPQVILRDPSRAPMLAAAQEAVRIGDELMAAYLAAARTELLA